MNKLPSESQSQRATSFWKKATNSLSLMLLGGGIVLGSNYITSSPRRIVASTPLTQIAQTQLTSETAIVPQNFVTDVVNNVGSAVVRINASRTVALSRPRAFDPSRRYFGSHPNFPDTQVQQGTGSGFIVSSDGLILTNSHVLDGADKVTVTLKDGRTVEGEVMGQDNLTDLAVVKIEEENLPTVVFGDSEALQIGEWAIAIGNPLGLDNTVTTGIISATGRNSMQIGVGDKRIDFIQTDAAINPGNSGGPLLNAKGEVIGINTAIIKNAQGLGFAIPINSAKDIAEQLIANGKVDHPFLGIRMSSITPELKQQLTSQYNFEIGVDEGVLIVEVLPNSPAASAGLKQGDIITAIEGEDVILPNEVQKIVARSSAGDTLNLQLIRRNQTTDLPIQVGILPNS